MLSDPSMDGEIQSISDRIDGGNPDSRERVAMIISCFATFHLKGFSHTQSSIEVLWQWHEGKGNWFAWCVRALAGHYQIFEKLPIEKRGGAGNT